MDEAGDGPGDSERLVIRESTMDPATDGSTLVGVGL
jgi:hypothetical protein